MNAAAPHTHSLYARAHNWYAALRADEYGMERLRTWLLLGTVAFAVVLNYLIPETKPFLYAAAILGALPTALEAIRSTREATISIDTFNIFAIIASLVAGEARSAAFIDLMLGSAALLDIFTSERSTRATEELLRMKPTKARREAASGAIEEVPIESVAVGDVVLVSGGDRVPVDGVVVFGDALLNESSITGESVSITKKPGMHVTSGTLSESGVLKVRATAVGADSTIERMAALIKDAATNKSNPERLADRFAAIFLPLVGVIGIGIYLLTGDITKVVALFLVACADDIAVAIPLAMTAALGHASKMGVLLKGGARLDAFGRVSTLVLDKTGTITYGSRRVTDATLAQSVDESEFWKIIGSAEKFSEQPMGQALFREACSRMKDAPADPESFEAIVGNGIKARVSGKEVRIGSREFLQKEGVVVPLFPEGTHTSDVFVAFDGSYAGAVSLADVARPEAKHALARLRALGVRPVMFTGDAEPVAKQIAETLAIEDVRARMKPEDKLSGIEEFIQKGEKVAVVGDGVNDAPALARADVGIAMGGTGMAVTVEAADIVILTDNLARLPDTIELARRTRSVVYGDMAIWAMTNLVGFVLVFLGFLGPVLAAVYNFLTDFLPLLNSARLFSGKTYRPRATPVVR